MRVIFLDVDGVLLTKKAFWNAQQTPGAPVLFSQRALAALRYLTERSGAQVVLTSSWRPRPGSAPSRLWLRLQSVLAHNRTPAVGAAPVLSGGADRGAEIVAWLEENPAEQFVILDDSDRLASHPALRARLVRVDPAVGLTEENAEAALEKLLIPQPPA